MADEIGVGVDLDIGALQRETADAAGSILKIVDVMNALNGKFDQAVQKTEAWAAKTRLAMQSMDEATRKMGQGLINNERTDGLLRNLGQSNGMRTTSSPNGGSLADDQLKLSMNKAIANAFMASQPALEASLKQAFLKSVDLIQKSTAEAIAAAQTEMRFKLNQRVSTYNDPAVVHSMGVAADARRIGQVQQYGGYASGADYVLSVKQQSEQQARDSAMAALEKQRMSALQKQVEQEARGREAATTSLDRQRSSAMQQQVIKENRDREAASASLERQRSQALQQQLAEELRLRQASEVALEKQRMAALQKQVEQDAKLQNDPVYRIQQEKRARLAQQIGGKSLDEYEASLPSKNQKAPTTPLDRLGRRTETALDYATIGAGIYGVGTTLSSVIELEDAFKRFQAITQTSNHEMESFSANLLKLGEGSRFAIKDLTDAATTLGQTGLAANEVEKALKPVIDLATASGSTLRESVDAITATIGAFQMDANRAGDVANMMTAALNQTKLTMNQLSMVVQYAGSVAHDAGLGPGELLSVAGGLAQAGVRSGSTIGTGTRQLIQELTAPSDKLLATLRPLGISLADIDVRTNGLVGALDNLRTKGFGTAEALHALDLRAASAFSALSGQVETMKELQASITLTNAAAEGAKTASESLSAAMTRLGNTGLSVAATALKPTVGVLTSWVDGLSAVLSTSTALTPVLQLLGSAAAAAGTAFAGSKLLGFLGLAIGGEATVAAGIILGIVGAMTLFARGIDNLDDKLDRLKGRQNELQTTEQQTRTSITSMGSMMDSLIARRENLNRDPLLRRNAIIEAQTAFKDLGLSVKNNATNIDELIDALGRLRSELSKELPGTLEKRLKATDDQIQTMIQQSNQTDKSGSRYNTMARLAPQVRGRFGNRFDDVMNFVNSPADNLDLSDVRGTSGGMRGRLRESLIGADSKTAGVLQKLIDILDEKTNQLLPIQSARIGRESVANSAQVAEIESTPQYRALLDQQKNLKEQLASGVASARGIQDPNARLDAFRKLASSMRPGAMSAGVDADALEKSLSEGGRYGEQNISTALKDIRSWITGLQKGVVSSIEDVRKEAEPLEQLVLGEQLKTNKSEISRKMKLAQQAHNSGQVDILEGEIKSLYEAQKTIEEELMKSQAPVDGQLTDKQQAALKEAKEGIQVKEQELTETMAQRRKAITDATLAFDSQVLGIQKQGVDANIKKLEAELARPGTTEARAKELREAIDKLIAQARDIVNRQADVDGLRTRLNAKGDFQVAPGAGATAMGIQSTLGGAGRGDLLGLAMAFAQQESAMNPLANRDNNKSAKGLFQFMPSTWAENGGGDMYDVATQVKNFVTYITKIDAAMKAALGHAPDDFERYVGWQQGTAGGPALLKNPGAKASSIVGENAVTQNGGTLDMTAAQFVDVIRKQFEKSVNSSLKYDAGTVAKKDEALTKAQGESDKASAEYTKTVTEKMVTEQKNLVDRLQQAVNLGQQYPDSKFGAQSRQNDQALIRAKQQLDLMTPIQEAEATIAALERQITSEKESGIATEERLAELDGRKTEAKRQLLLLQQKYNAELDAEKTKGSMSAAFGKGTDDFFKQAGMYNANGQFKSFTEEMSGYWTQAMGGMNSSLSGLFYNLASGTMKGKDAFRQFATSIIQDMLKIASEAASKEILKQLFGGLSSGGGGLFSSLFGGGAADNFAGQAAGAIGPFPMATGGMIHAANGYSVPTRDSVPIMARPGEYVLRKSAVDMIGRDQLDNINSLGNRAISQAPTMPPAQKQEPGHVAVWVVSPDQVPPPGPRDIIATISSDIQNRGQIRQLIKQVQMGAV